jgi:hypothetical protein
MGRASSDHLVEPITCAAPLRLMAPAPTSPEEDASRSSGIPAKGVSAVATSEGGATPVGDVAEEDAPRTLRRSSRNAGRADEHTLLKA